MKMDVFRIALLFVLLHVTVVHSNINLEINNRLVGETFNVLRAIEGSSLLIQCFGSTGNLYFKWFKIDDLSFIKYDANMSIPLLVLDNAGDYSCLTSTTLQFTDGETEQRNINIDVLYQPVTPVISGPERILEGDMLTLTCAVECNPPATYVWTNRFVYDLTSGLHIIGRNSSFEESYYTSMHGPYCYVRQTMEPTFGDPIPIVKYKQHRLTTEVEAYIWNVGQNYEFEIGQNMIINPNVKGNPFPAVWWTKEGNAQFTYNERKLIIVNVTMDYTERYTFWARNIVHLPSGKEKTITVSVRTHINIIDKTVPEVCPLICQTEYNSVSSPQSKSSTTTEQMLPSELNLTNSPDPTSRDCPKDTEEEASTWSITRITLVAVLAVGWACFVIVLLIVLIMRIRHLKRDSPSELANKYVSNQPDSVEQATEHNDVARDPPSKPQHQGSVRSTDYTYVDLEPSQRNTNQYSDLGIDTLNGVNGGYISPCSVHGREVATQ